MDERRNLSLQEHQLLGIKLTTQQDYLARLAAKLRDRYGDSHPAAILAGRAANDVNSLRSELDDQLYRDHPAQSNSRVYYPTGMNREGAKQ